MPYEPYHLGSRKHVFIDWSLMDPGYGLSFGGDRAGELGDALRGAAETAPAPAGRRR